MDFKDVGFLPFHTSFTPHFSKIVIEVKASKPPELLRVWLRGKQRYAPFKIFSLLEILLFVSVNFHGK